MSLPTREVTNAVEVKWTVDRIASFTAHCSCTVQTNGHLNSTTLSVDDGDLSYPVLN